MVKTLGGRHPLVLLSQQNYANPLYALPSPYTACQGPYALCTSASCQPDPTTGQLTCYCDIYNGTSISLANSPCSQMQPFTYGGNSYVYSLYSGINANQLTFQTCNSGAWADCLTKVCQVDPLNPTKAFCYCGNPITKTPSWVTGQLNTNTAPCACNNQSGATQGAYQNIQQY
jgi:hypothetical protein